VIVFVTTTSFSDEEMYTTMSNWIRFVNFNYMKMMRGLQSEFADRDKDLRRSVVRKPAFIYRLSHNFSKSQILKDTRNQGCGPFGARTPDFGLLLVIS
jgi:hypothetical protein